MVMQQGGWKLWSQTRQRLLVTPDATRTTLFPRVSKRGRPCPHFSQLLTFWCLDEVLPSFLSPLGAAYRHLQHFLSPTAVRTTLSCQSPARIPSSMKLAKKISVAPVFCQLLISSLRVTDATLPSVFCCISDATLPSVFCCISVCCFIYKSYFSDWFLRNFKTVLVEKRLEMTGLVS